MLYIPVENDYNTPVSLKRSLSDPEIYFPSAVRHSLIVAVNGIAPHDKLSSSASSTPRGIGDIGRDSKEIFGRDWLIKRQFTNFARATNIITLYPKTLLWIYAYEFVQLYSEICAMKLLEHTPGSWTGWMTTALNWLQFSFLDLILLAKSQ